MKKIARRFLTVLLAALMVFALSATAFAADYTVKAYSGTIGGGTVESKGVNYGESVSLPINVTVTDSKYYVKGVKEAGKDTQVKGLANGETFTVSNVKKDMDFVVDYGPADNAVEYTVNYLDNDGNALAASRVLQGDPGDKPVVAAAYIDGYVPATLQLTGTLKEDASQNVFTFYYREALPGENVEETIEAANGGANGQPGVTIEEVQVPRDIVDLDDEETPLANTQLDSGMSATAIALLSAGALAIIGCLIWAFLKKKKEEPNEG